MLGKDWKGAFACDEHMFIKNKSSHLSDVSRIDGLMIVNNKTRAHGGEHWVAVASKDGTLYVFDSFGRPTKDLIPSLYNSKLKVRDSDYDKDQNVSQTDCGSRCIGWLMLLKEHGVENALLL